MADIDLAARRKLCAIDTPDIDAAARRIAGEIAG